MAREEAAAPVSICPGQKISLSLTLCTAEKKGSGGSLTVTTAHKPPTETRFLTM